ncbi:hypothetical protein [Niabella ginsengisoli]|uniref:Electron transfer flavoprotein alpha/beta-subunit N-terminal domain-containing protein n=1 Tax=Niabella ginsengisoli TaxID=522298 RepID=A0ABS9SGZ9_9BACT|nr:hypothetical protein [Niabella ginsengisoli]MCH5597646.1 hypothetical protein [Niabella ginsengisoli]
MVLIFIDIAEDGSVKKTSLESLTYGTQVAKQLGVEAHGIVLAPTTEDLVALGKYGITKVHQAKNESLKHFDAQVYTNAIAQVAEQTNASVIVFSNNTDGKAVAPRLSASLKAGLVAGAVSLPETSDGFVVKKVFFQEKHLQV